MQQTGGTLTMLLNEWRGGSGDALEQLTARVYSELRRIAARHLHGERAGHAFRPTDLVSEAFVRLMDGQQPEWNDRVHFFAFASRLMRQILVDHARKGRAAKRGAGVAPVAFDDAVVSVDDPEELLALDSALNRLEQLDARKARAAELHFFGGLTQKEVAEALGCHVNTISDDLRFASAWLRLNLRGEA